MSDPVDGSDHDPTCMQNGELCASCKSAVAALPRMQCLTCEKRDAVGFRHHAGMCTIAAWCEECGDPPCDFCGRLGVSFASPWDLDKRPQVYICVECVVGRRRHPTVQS